MGFHSDSEPGVQGTIASLSLGSPASMRFRPLKRWACKKTSGNEAVVLQLELYHVCNRSPTFIALACDRLCVLQGDFVIMDGPDIQKLYEVCCDSYHVLPIVDWFPPTIARGGSKGIPVFGYCSPYYYMIAFSSHYYCTLML